jgi:hypothetical protein
MLWCFQFQARAAVPIPGGPSASSRRTIHVVKFVQAFFVFIARS